MASETTYSQYLQGNKGTFIESLTVGDLSLKTVGALTSGSWTPVLTNVSAGFNPATLANAYGQYIRLGDYVHVSFGLDIDVLTFVGGAGLQFEVSVPISSTLTDSTQYCSGSATLVDLVAPANSKSCLLQGFAADKMIFKAQNGTATVAGTVRCSASGIYKIV